MAKQCPLDISLLWSAEVGSPVYSAPVIIPSPVEGRKQIAVATLLNTVELLEGDGSVPVSWPVELEGLMFLGSPAVHDIDGDGTQDICVGATNGIIRCFSTGDREPSMEDYTLKLKPHSVSQDRLSELEGAEKGSREIQADHGASNGGRRLQAEDVPPNTEGSSGVMDLDAMAAYLDGDWGWGQEDSLGDDGFWGNYYGDVLNPHDSDGDLEVDAHVLASPVFVDVDGDGKKEIIVAVTYFSTPSWRSDHHPSSSPDMGSAQGRGYVASALAWKFDSGAPEISKDLGETLGDEKSSSAHASPTVADIDADQELDIIIGTAEGKLHIFNAKSGEERAGFPMKFGAIMAQVAVADVDNDRQLEIFFGDATGKLVCLKLDTTECWSKELGGEIMHSVTLGDMNGDGKIDVVVGNSLPSGEGQVSAFTADTGEPLDGFPVGLGNSKGISAPILILDLHEDSAAQSTPTGGGETEESQGHAGKGLHLLAPSEDGHVYVIEAVSGGCRSKIDVGGGSMSMVLADDIDGDSFLDLVVGTMGGEVVAISTNVPFHPQNAWRSPVRGHLNGFVHGSYQGVYFSEPPSKYHQVMGPEFIVPFKIVDERPHKDDRKYQVTISSGDLILYRGTLTTAGDHEAKIVSLSTPKQYTLRIEMTNVFHQVFEDHITVAYNVGFHVLVKWIILIPLVLTASLIWWAPLPRDRDSMPR